MIQVGNTGLYFDDGYKGHFTIYFRRGRVFRNNNRDADIILEGVDVDCSGEIFKAIQKYADFKRNIDGKKFLKDNEWLIRECIMEQYKGQRSMGKCYKCGVDDSPQFEPHSEEAYNAVFPACCMTAEWSRNYTAGIDYTQDKFVATADAPIRKLKDFDLRSPYIYGLHMISKIKSIKPPVLHKNEYYQDCKLCDDDTNKIIECELDDNIADFDKWHNGDSVETWGIYKDGLYSITSMELIEVDTSEPVTVNRNSETPGYNEWRNSIVNRDKKCVCCGLDKHLEAHHLFGYKENPSLAVNPSNGITLCKFCHDKYHSVYGLKDINPVDFVDFIKRFGVR